MKSMMILLAHGSSNKNWAQTFLNLTKTARQKHQNVRLAYMELSTPSLEEVIQEAAELGYTDISVLPLFLAKGKHLLHDIPEQLKTLENLFNIKSHLLSPIGEQPEIAAAINQIIERKLKL